ncbi:MAG: type II toxin-antitoxin system VapC family toxin [archaeon]|nr:type II toxin-antitoxin system VapC family toxin [archaeon]
MAIFFYDSYAVLAYLDDHPRYGFYFEENDGFLTKLNLMEIYYRMFEGHGSHAASRVITAFSKYQKDFDINEVKGSMRLRFRLKKRGLNISYADALGYHLALKAGIRFLTGDPAFEKLERVEFVP